MFRTARTPVVMQPPVAYCRMPLVPWGSAVTSLHARCVLQTDFIMIIVIIIFIIIFTIIIIIIIIIIIVNIIIIIVIIIISIIIVVVIIHLFSTTINSQSLAIVCVRGCVYMCISYTYAFCFELSQQ